ncbi:transfer protein spdA [Streptomyces sp. enrichment culture]|uniref:transfer protein spdA n=1 Tax=Streptomyces sp. enrichment culture TaxID=1795815 RepID=UPI003F5735EF
MARYAALLAAMLISFDTQRHLALSHGISDEASYAVPVAIDLFLVWAVRSRRDVALAVGVAVSANVAGVLSSEPLSAVGTWVGAALHAVFPLTVWRMHRAERPQVAVEGPQALTLAPGLSAPEIAPQVSAEPVRDSWPDDDLWRDFEATAPDSEADSVATPPKPDDIRVVIAALESEHGRPVTGQMIADHYGVSPRTGRRYMALAGGGQ